MSPYLPLFTFRLCFSLILFSSSSHNLLFSFRTAFTVSLPCPNFSPLYEYQEPLFSNIPSSVAISIISPSHTVKSRGSNLFGSIKG